jgi:pSer/pThr/pTyr-binding forkhead associated (FHA) protein
MGTLFHQGRGTCYLDATQTVGRSAGCELLIPVSYVSNRHAEIRWRDGCWRIKDLGSLNGTFLNAVRLEPALWQPMARGDKLAFGDLQHEEWLVDNVDEPVPMLVPLDGGSPVSFQDRVAGLPADEPLVTIWQDGGGLWWLEDEEGNVREVSERGTFDVRGRTWRLSSGSSTSTTALSHELLATQQLTLSIRHSLDEEHVEVVAKAGQTTQSLGARSHHYVLLHLARQRLADREAGIAEGSCGWVYQDELIRQLGIDRVQLNVNVFRLRQQLSSLSLKDPAAVVERRVQTRQIRIGVRSLDVTRL